MTVRDLFAGILGRRKLGPFDSWARVGFDFANYGPLRNAGLTHKEACAELERAWDAR
jgi:hypothetical protein